MNNTVKAGNIYIGDGIPKICVPIVEETQSGIFKMAQAVYESDADIAEWRADFYNDCYNTEKVMETLSNIKEILKDKPVLFTFRTAAEGGNKDISYKDYAALLVRASAEADLVDTEMYRSENITGLTSIIKKSSVIVGSYHDFRSTPATEEMTDRLVYMYNAGADIPKIAVMPASEMDVIRLMEASLKAKELLKGNPVITMSMSGMGLVSRIAAENTGSAVTFGCIGRPSAPGQIEVNKLIKMLDILHYKTERETTDGQA